MNCGTSHEDEVAYGAYIADGETTTELWKANQFTI
jgi:hypothetical protein